MTVIERMKMTPVTLSKNRLVRKQRYPF